MPSPEIKVCQNCKNRFTIEPEDFLFYEKIKVPPPTWCPGCRMIRRMSWRGLRELYKNKCRFSGEEVVSFYHPDSPYKIYKQDIWWSDKWDTKEYGRGYDFSRPFFIQFDELLKSVPFPALNAEHSTLINSDYCNVAATLKNCYLCFRSDHGENCAYMDLMVGMKESLDSSFSTELELCYEAVTSSKCYRVFYSQDCESSHNIYFSKNLTGCSYCIGCINLRNKNYYFFNQSCSKEAWERKLAELNLGSYEEREKFKDKIESFMAEQPERALRGRQNSNVSGEYIFNSKNVVGSFMVRGGENIKYSQLLKSSSAEIQDCTEFGMKAEWIYESCWVGLGVGNLKFSFWNYNAHHLEYCVGCHGSGNLFGCVNLRNSEYCIFNKQYRKEEYGDMVDRIKKQMAATPYVDRLGRAYTYGEFFPSEMSPWGYNETTAQDFFPLDQDRAEKAGFNWRASDKKEYQPATIQLPDYIKEISDGILKEILKCLGCGRNYRVIPMELTFYRKLIIPIPHFCYFCRFRGRVELLNPVTLFDRRCAGCSKDIKTSYHLENPKIVYCEQCYNNEVV